MLESPVCQPSSRSRTQSPSLFYMSFTFISVFTCFDNQYHFQKTALPEIYKKPVMPDSALPVFHYSKGSPSVILPTMSSAVMVESASMSAMW